MTTVSLLEMETRSINNSPGLINITPDSFGNGTNGTIFPLVPAIDNNSYSEYYNNSGPGNGYNNETGQFSYFDEEYRYYSTLVICFIGMVANVLCLLVITTSKLRKNTAGIYMAGLAVADFMYMFSQFVGGIKSHENSIMIVDNNRLLCRTMRLVIYGSQTWSSLLTISITVERFLIVSFPLKIKNILTLKVSLIVVIVSGILSCCLNFYGYHTYDIVFDGVYVYCDVADKHLKLYGILAMVVLTGIGDFFSNIIVFTLTVLIICKLLRARKMRKSMAASQKNNQQNKEMHVTAMVLSVAVLYLVCKIPYGATWSTGYFGFVLTETLEQEAYDRIIMLQNYLYTLFLLNHCVNFFLYMIFSSNYREALLNLFCCGRRRRNSETSLSVTTRTTISTISLENGKG